jgi:hypothetical protein
LAGSSESGSPVSAAFSVPPATAAAPLPVVELSGFDLLLPQAASTALRSPPLRPSAAPRIISVRRSI